MLQMQDVYKRQVLDHVKAINKHTKGNLIDYIITNNEVIPDDCFKKYKKDGSNQVLLSKEQRNSLKNMGIKIIEGDLIEIKNDYIRPVSYTHLQL